MVAQLAPSLLRVCHRFSMLDGSNPDAEAEALPPPSGASPRHVRPPRVLSARDVAALREEEATHLWQQVAAQLQGDWERIFEVSRRSKGRLTDRWRHTLSLIPIHHSRTQLALVHSLISAPSCP